MMQRLVEDLLIQYPYGVKLELQNHPSLVFVCEH